VAAGQRPAAPVDPQLVDPSVGLAVGDDRDRNVDVPCLTVEVQDHLLEAASLGDDMLDILDRDAAPAEPRVRFGDERLERPRTLDAPAHGVVQLRLAGEGFDQRIGLAGHQTGEVGNGHELVVAPLVLELCEHRRREQLGDPRHPRSVPYPVRCGQSCPEARRVYGAPTGRPGRGRRRACAD
jgi:hypothetical protein